jgi:hypothetical protein
MKKLILVTAVVGAFAFPAGALAGTFTGVVVGKSSGHLAVASKSGAVQNVSTRAHPQLGARVRVSGATVRVIGVAHRARIHAVVVKRAGSTTLVAAGRTLLAIRSSGRRLSSLAGSGPTTGAVVNSTVDIANGQLTQQSMQVVGQSGTAIVQAQVTGVAAGTITVLVNGKPFSIALPAGIQLPASLVGQFVTLNLSLAQDGATATAGDDNENDNDNDDQDENQNDDHAQNQGHDDQGDHGDGGDD